jgi:hypothetical protein
MMNGKKIGINQAISGGIDIYSPNPIFFNKCQYKRFSEESALVQCIKHDNTIEGLRRLQQRLNQASFSTTAHYLQFGATKKEAMKIEEIFR